MSNPIGHTYMYNFIILFIVIIFAFLAGAMSYYKSYKVNNAIVYSIEKYEGYNDLSKAEISRILTTLGYDTNKYDCKADAYKGMTLVNDTTKSHNYCIYIEDKVTSGNHANGEYFVYGVRTYMTIDLPVVRTLKIPVFTKTNQIYKFTTSAGPKMNF